MNHTRNSLKSRPLRASTQAAAAAGFALMSANADIVYVDNLNVSFGSSAGKNNIPAGVLTEVPVTLAGVPAFTAKVQADGLNPPPVIGFNGFTNGFQAYADSKSSGQIVAFAEGTTISGIPADQTDINLTAIYNTALGLGITASPRPSYYVGFEFNPTGNQPLFGWMELQATSVSPNTPTFTLTRYAYDDSGAPIAAGEIPQPSGIIFRDNLNLAAIESKGDAGIVNVDIDDDGLVDFRFRSNPANNEVGFSEITNFEYIVTGAPAGQAKIFAAGENIAGPISPFNDPVALNSWFTGAGNGDTAYFGFNFFIGADQVPGWIELQRTDAFTLTLVRLAYHYDGEPIAAGQTGLELPPPLRVLDTEYVADAGDGLPAFRVTVPGRTGFLYQLLRSPDLVSPFANIGAPLPGTGVPLVLTDSALLPNRGFYQVSESPAP